MKGKKADILLILFFADYFKNFKDLFGFIPNKKKTNTHVISCFKTDFNIMYTF